MFTNAEEKSGSFTFAAEGSSDPKNKFFYGNLAHPSANSGVTIGAGYDMASRSEVQIKSDLTSAGASTDTAAKIAKAAGLKGTEADQFVETNKTTLKISDLEVLKKLFANIFPDYVKRAKQSFSYHAQTFSTEMPKYGDKYKNAIFFDWNSLYPAIRVIAVDFVYQGFGKQKAGFGKPMHFCMANDFDWLIKYIQTSTLSQYEKGRGRVKYLKSKQSFEVNAYSSSMPD